MREWFVCFLLFLYVKAAQELRLLFANKGRGSSEAREYWLAIESSDLARKLVPPLISSNGISRDAIVGF